ncbi:thioredoxin domain-containing protein 12-like [Mizuhopecten yessoensis]|uniref:thioredoxin domain-containing protein 12-like n=1 Tax=Mizuhopecten yessoensis TaxID=6573 RepID=UPI000B458034|nr:thioredoxin domain-containing protein 12-like [Mizuhopecten yessoensis]
MADKMNLLAWMLFTCHISLVFSNELARGWGDGIAWVKLDDGLTQAKTENKPMMLIIHKSWCGACKSLKPKVEESTAIKELSKEFVMVNTEDDEEPSDSKFTPDGGYIPRIFFLDNNGEVLNDHYNKDGNSQYKYYYYSPDHIVKSMKAVLETLKGDNTATNDEL